MSGKRASLPGAAELFRSTRTTPEPPSTPSAETTQASAAPGLALPASADRGSSGQGVRRSGSGRGKHSTKITVYVSDEELLEMEQARLMLRAAHGIVTDRGRLVREAVAVLLEDLDANGADSTLVARLRRAQQ